MVTESRRSAAWATDWLLSAGLFLGVIALRVSLPFNIGESDEGLFLYEAKRVLDGEVFYRDIFEIITPGAFYAMALVFAVFGTTLVAAKVAMAVVHALIVVSIYAVCRVLGTGTVLSLAAALAHVALGQYAWPHASPHWVSTLLTLLLLLVALRRPWLASARGAAVPGVVIGALISVQQQKGVVLGVAFVVLLLLDHLIRRRYGYPSTARDLGARIVCLGLGALVLTLPVLGGTALFAGVGAMYRALVHFAFFNYGKLIHTSWGSVPIMTHHLARYTQPAVLSALPLILPVPFLRVVGDLLARRAEAEVASLTTLLVLAVFSILSIQYFPDFIHVAFIAPLFFVLVAETLDRASRQLARLAGPLVAARAVVAVGLLGALAVQVYANAERMRKEYRITLQTEFGRVAFRNNDTLELIETVLELTRRQPQMELFCYIGYPSLYLMTGTKNPTPFQLLHPNYNDPDQLLEAADILERRQVPFVVLFDSFLRGEDPLLQYIRGHYEPYDPERPNLLLYRRKRPGPVAQPEPLGRTPRATLEDR